MDACSPIIDHYDVRILRAQSMVQNQTPKGSRRRRQVCSSIPVMQRASFTMSFHLKQGELTRKEIYRTLKPPNSHDPAVNTRLAVALERGKEGGVTKAHVEHVMAKVRAA